jgi:hypothetical protein
MHLASGSNLSLVVGYLAGTVLYASMGWRALPADVRGQMLSVLQRKQPQELLQER